MFKISTKTFFYIRHPKFGSLKFRKINLNDLIKIEKFKANEKKYKDFSIFVLHNQIENSNIRISEIKALNDQEIVSMIKNFIKNDTFFSKYFKETNDDEFFLNFYYAYKNFRKELSKSFVPIGEVFARLATQISKSLAKIAQVKISPPFTKTLKILSKEALTNIQKIIIVANNAGGILKKYEWIITPSMDMRIATYSHYIGDKPGNHRREINRLFLDYFQRDNFEELEVMIKRWKSNKLFKPRIKIIEDCLKVLQLSGQTPSFYAPNVIIPTLIAQIDGIWTDYIESKGLNIRKLSKNEILKTLSEKKKEEIKNSKVFKGFPKLDDLVRNVILDVLFQDALPRKRPEKANIPSRFNRHKILHGEYISYGSIYNVLRAFLILDFLYYLN